MLTLALFAALLLWGCTLLAQAGLFHTPIILLLAAVLAVAIVRLTASSAASRDKDAPRPRRTGAPAALVAAAVAVLVAIVPPVDAVLWQGDATVHRTAARLLAQQGSMAFEDPLFDELARAGAEDALTNRTFGDATGRAARLPGGFRAVGESSRRVSAPFSPAMSVALATVKAARMPDMVEYLPSVLLLLSSVTLLLLAGSVVPTPLALLVVAATISAFPQLWFSRLPMGEILAQWLVLAGLLAMLRPRGEAPSVRMHLVAGVLLGVSTLAKAELVAVLGIALAWWLLRDAATDTTQTGRRTRHALAAGFAAPALFGAARYLLGEGHYADAGALLLPGMTLPAACAAAVVVLGTLIARRHRVVLPWVLAAAYASLYAGLTASAAGPSGLAALRAAIPAPIAAAILAAPVVGALATSSLPRRQQSWWALAAAMLASALFHWTLSPWEIGDPLWVSRRLVPVALPLAYLGLAVGAAGPATRRGARRVAVAAAVLALVIALQTQRSVALGAAATAPRTDAQLATLRRSMPPEARALVDDRLAGTHLATGLSYVEGVPSLVLPPAPRRASWARPLALHWLGAGKSVVLLVDRSVAAGRGDLGFFAPEVDLLASSEWTLWSLRPGTADASTSSHRVHADVHVLRAEPAPSGRRAADIGSWPQDLVYDLRAFHGPEFDSALPTGTFRWTRERSELRLPGSAAIRLGLVADRPDPAPPAVLSILLDGRPRPGLQGLSLGPGLQELIIPSDPAAESVVVTLVSETFNPSRLGLSADDRDLGVRLFRAEILADAR